MGKPGVNAPIASALCSFSGDTYSPSKLCFQGQFRAKQLRIHAKTVDIVNLCHLTYLGSTAEAKSSGIASPVTKVAE